MKHLSPEVRAGLEAWPQVSPILSLPQNEPEYRRLVALLDGLIDEVGENESHPWASLMDLVGTLIERYEDEHVPVLESER
jgi:HTH-type transcriptional regulator/antitoxin HigA